VIGDRSARVKSVADGAWPIKPRFVGLNRRAFLLGAAATALAACDQFLNRRSNRVPRIGHLSVNPLTTNETGWQGFLNGLRDHGWVSGENVAIEWRDAGGATERLPDLAAELIGLPVDLIVTGTLAGVMAATRASARVPVVMMAVSDPVGSGIVTSLARPGGQVTGTASIGPQLTAKRVEFLKEAIPAITRSAILWNPSNPAEATAFGEAQNAAKILGLELQSLPVRAIEDFNGAFQAAVQGRAQALLDGGGPLLANNRKRILDFAERQKVSVIGRGRPWVEDGALMSYGGNSTDQWRRAASHVDRILRGTSPGDLPIELPTTFELLVNLRTAEALGLTFGRSFLDQVTEVLR
jgi:putative ABC transport system substrate-binding protein